MKNETPGAQRNFTLYFRNHEHESFSGVCLGLVRDLSGICWFQSGITLGSFWYHLMGKVNGFAAQLFPGPFLAFGFLRGCPVQPASKPLGRWVAA